MKRFLALILLLVYSATTIGASVEFHYCMGKLSGWSLSWAGYGSDKCSKCGMKKVVSIDKGCCKDEIKFLKIQDDQKANYISLEISKLSVAVPVFADLNFVNPLPSSGKLIPSINAPPRSSIPDLCIRHCIFRI